jgi:hypothetical protein
MTAHVIAFPRPTLITGTRDDQLDAALEISARVFAGDRVSLQAMLTTREVIDSRTNAKATVALLGTYIDARREEIRTEARKAAQRGTIRAGLVDCAGLAVIVAVALAVLAW